MDKFVPLLNRDQMAVCLSVIPGLGHLYKHQFRSGLLTLLPGNLIAVLGTALMAYATLGAAVIVAPALWVGWCAWDAYDAPDLSPRPLERAEA